MKWQQSGEIERVGREEKASRKIQSPDYHCFTNRSPLWHTERGSLCSGNCCGRKIGVFRETSGWLLYHCGLRQVVWHHSPRSSCPGPSPCARLCLCRSWSQRAVCPHCETATQVKQKSLGLKWLVAWQKTVLIIDFFLKQKHQAFYLLNVGIYFLLHASCVCVRMFLSV